MGTQINKGARKGACRDLSGRRMRDVDAEKKYVIYLVVYVCTNTYSIIRVWSY